MFRTFALVWREVSREACRNQGAEIKIRLERSLESSGLPKLNEKHLCIGDLCQGKTFEDLGLDRTVRSIRDEQLNMYRQKSSTETEMACRKFVAIFENVRGGSALARERIFDRFVVALNNEK